MECRDRIDGGEYPYGCAQNFAWWLEPWSAGNEFQFHEKIRIFLGKKNVFMNKYIFVLEINHFFFSIGWNLYRSNCGSYYSTGFDTKNYQTNS